MKELALESVSSVKHGEGVSVQVRNAPESDYIFVMNFTEENQVVTFELPVTDKSTGEELLGNVWLEKYEVQIVEKKRTTN